MPTGLTAKQAKTAKIIKTRVKAGEELSQTLLKEATVKGYELVGSIGNRTPTQIASDIVNKNMKSAQFLAALGFEHRDTKEYIASHVFKNLEGKNEVFGYDPENPDKRVLNVDVYKHSLGIAARASFETQHRITVEHDYSKRSIKDLEFFAENGRFPEEAPIIDAEFSDA